LANRDRYDTEYLKILQYLVETRVMRGMLQEDVATAMGTNQSRVSRLESGEIRSDILDYVRYCAAVDLDPGYPLKALFQAWRKI
jgi:transcriptional regulator with XRE-family HTH domain